MMKSESTDQFTTSVIQVESSISNEEDVTATENFTVNANFQTSNKETSLNEKIAAFCSSWKFIVLMSVILAIWVVVSLIWWNR